MSTAVPTAVTPEDLLTMPDGERYELIDGTLKELPVSQTSSWIAGETYRRIANFVTERNLGWVYPEGTSYQCFPWDPTQVRRPDTSFIAFARMPHGPGGQGHCRIVPDLVVEVISPNDRYTEVEIKIGDYLEAGVKLIWVIDPETSNVKVIQGDSADTQRTVGIDGVLSGGDVLPGFECPVRGFFPPRPILA